MYGPGEEISDEMLELLDIAGTHPALFVSIDMWSSNVTRNAENLLESQGHILLNLHSSSTTCSHSVLSRLRSEVNLKFKHFQFSSQLAVIKFMNFSREVEIGANFCDLSECQAGQC